MFQELREKLETKRNFNAINYILNKADAINKFYRDNELDSAVIGMSGGIDSAVVYKLLRIAKGNPNSPIKYIFPVIIPIHCAGITGQEEAVDRAELVLKDDPDYQIINATQAANSILANCWPGKLPTNHWAKGQMAYMLRPAILYYQAALLQANGYKSIVVGTINRSEGSYVGYFGKYSDGAIDISVISDIYKTEVYKIAQYLELPDEILEVPPMGNISTGETDEEVMGLSYEYLDTILMVHEFGWPVGFHLTPEENKVYVKNWTAVEEMHQKNAHKYKGTSLAQFVDVMPRKIKGGWQ